VIAKVFVQVLQLDLHFLRKFLSAAPNGSSSETIDGLQKTSARAIANPRV